MGKKKTAKKEQKAEKQRSKRLLKLSETCCPPKGCKSKCCEKYTRCETKRCKNCPCHDLLQTLQTARVLIEVA